MVSRFLKGTADRLATLGVIKNRVPLLIDGGAGRGGGSGGWAMVGTTILSLSSSPESPPAVSSVAAEAGAKVWFCRLAGWPSVRNGETMPLSPMSELATTAFLLVLF